MYNSEELIDEIQDSYSLWKYIQENPEMYVWFSYRREAKEFIEKFNEKDIWLLEDKIFVDKKRILITPYERYYKDGTIDKILEILRKHKIPLYATEKPKKVIQVCYGTNGEFTITLGECLCYKIETEWSEKVNDFYYRCFQKSDTGKTTVINILRPHYAVYEHFEIF